jgi:hypothetical protein
MVTFCGGASVAVTLERVRTAKRAIVAGIEALEPALLGELSALTVADYTAQHMRRANRRRRLGTAGLPGTSQGQKSYDENPRITHGKFLPQKPGRI